MTIKYCLNTGDVGGSGNRGGVIERINNYVGTEGYDDPDSMDKPIRGGKSSIDISCNYNTGPVESDSNSAGVVQFFHSFVYSNSCYNDITLLNNFNTGIITSNTAAAFRVGGVLGVLAIISSVTNMGPNNVSANIASNYNYTTSITGGGDKNRGGTVGQLLGELVDNITLSSNYSAYKRDADNNIHGTNVSGANVGEWLLFLCQKTSKLPKNMI